MVSVAWLRSKASRFKKPWPRTARARIGDEAVRDQSTEA